MNIVLPTILYDNEANGFSWTNTARDNNGNAYMFYRADNSANNYIFIGRINMATFAWNGTCGSSLSAGNVAIYTGGVNNLTNTNWQKPVYY